MDQGPDRTGNEGRRRQLVVRPQRPYVEQLPVRPTGGPARAALRDYVDTSVAWSMRPVAASGRLTAALWTLIAITAGVCSWLTVLLRSGWSCDATLCSSATLGGHPRVTLGIAIASLAAFAVLAMCTRGLTRMGGRELVALAPAAVGGVVAVIGAVTVLVLLGLLAAIAIAVLVLMVGAASNS
jgi:hypothetical protein